VLLFVSLISYLERNKESLAKDKIRAGPGYYFIYIYISHATTIAHSLIFHETRDSRGHVLGRTCITAEPHTDSVCRHTHPLLHIFLLTHLWCPFAREANGVDGPILGVFG
jgi:hypothetical protein